MKTLTGCCTEETRHENTRAGSQRAGGCHSAAPHASPCQLSAAAGLRLNSGHPARPPRPLLPPAPWVLCTERACCIGAVLAGMPALYGIQMTPLISLYSSQRRLQIVLPSACTCASRTLWNESQICGPSAYGDMDTEGVVYGH